MKLPRVSIGGAMLGVGLVALDLAAVRYLYDGDSRGQTPYLVMSLLPMINALALVAPGCFTGRSWRTFRSGFAAAGLAALVGQLAGHWMFPEGMSQFYVWPLTPFFEFSRKYLPWYFGARADQTAYWRYYLLLAIPYSLPQFVVAILGGLLVRGMSSRRLAPPQAKIC